MVFFNLDMPRIVLFMSLLHMCFQYSSSYRSRSILRSISTDKPDLPDFAIDLNQTTFDSILHDTPASYAVVEFFAKWCPACRNYKTHYEKVARLFNGPDAVHPGIILMTRVDCALKENNKLCDKFSVNHYPMLFWGRPSKFVSGSRDPKQEKTEIHMVDDGRTADRLLDWINKQMGSSYGLDDEKFENENLSSNISDPGQIERAIYDVEEATSTAFDIIFANKMIKSETRTPLVNFLQLLVAHHPSRRCRRGSADILMNFDDLWPSNEWLVDSMESIINNRERALKNFKVCGNEVPRGYWMFCRGSKNDTRGFSCGLWVLLHSLSVMIENGESQTTFRAVCNFIHKFFICEECRQHFYGMCSRVSTPFNKTQDFALWLWSSHNQVNERLMKEEASVGTGDPKFPKNVWPLRQLCPSCYASPIRKDNGSSHIEWNEGEVFKFLGNYYGKTLLATYKGKMNEKSDEKERGLAEDLAVATNAVVVPLGAALAIAVASCAFGALAWFWRTQQKNRKYIYQPHSLKNV